MTIVVGNLENMNKQLTVHIFVVQLYFIRDKTP